MSVIERLNECLDRHADLVDCVSSYDEWTELVQAQRAVMIGPIRQEILSGLRDGKQFNILRATLRAFDDLPIELIDYEIAADLSNKCGRRGVQGAPTDFLICAVSLRYDAPIFTTDGDFLRYAKHTDIQLYQVQVS